MITGYRRYNVVKDTLVGAQNTKWEQRTLVAECAREGGTREFKRALCTLHLEHDIDCRCGIYVAKDDYINGYNNLPVLAAISGWGAYVEYDYGWRIQHVRIEHMWISDALINADILCKKYEVECEVKSNVSSWVSAPQYQPNYAVTPQVCLRCNTMHDLSRWTPKGKPALLVCQMETSHVVNAKRYLEHLSSIGLRVPWHSKWIKIFEQALIDRTPRTNEDGKTVVKW